MMCEYKIYTLKSLITFTKASDCFSIMLYFSVASLKDLLKDAIGCSYPSSFFYRRTLATVWGDAKENIINGLV